MAHPPPKVVLVNAPYVRHRESGIFLGMDAFIAYEEAKEAFRLRHGKAEAHAFFPRDTGIAIGVRAGSRRARLVGPLSRRQAPFPFLLAYAAANLRKHGIAAEVLDCVSARIFQYGRFAEILERMRPELVIVESSAATEDIDLWACEQASGYARVALAGPNVTDATIPGLARECPRIAFFLKGEYVNSCVTLAKSMRPGVYETEAAVDPNSLPHPVRDFGGAAEVREGWLPDAEFPQLQVLGSMGAPPDHRAAPRSAGSIMREIREAVDGGGYRQIYFRDEVFNQGDGRVEELCGHLSALGLPWGATVRLDSSSAALFEKMLDSGCANLNVALGGFNREAAMRAGGTGEPAESYLTLLRLARRYPGVHLHLEMVRGAPGETDAMRRIDAGLLETLGFGGGENPYRSCVQWDYAEMSIPEQAAGRIA